MKRLKTAEEEDNCCAEVGETGDYQKDVGDGRKVMNEAGKRQGEARRKQAAGKRQKDTCSVMHGPASRSK